ncbi:MAG TPA: hypothetical protein VNY07_14995, partial [Chthoniobacterales bacterium]|nr:hypothetical protein [Chthoniobacterales bacterium]
DLYDAEIRVSSLASLMSPASLLVAALVSGFNRRCLAVASSGQLLLKLFFQSSDRALNPR